jgi:hypothetical protein
MIFKTRSIRDMGAIAVIGLALAGCGGGGGSSDDVDRTGPLALQAQAMVDRLERLAPSNTGFTGQPGEMPTTGSANFSGFAGLAVGGANPVDLTGRATLTADFSNLTITGSANRFEGATGGNLVPYAGTINFVNGEIGRSTAVPLSVPNDIRFRYEGQLDARGSRIEVGADATGKFRGTPIRGLVAESDSAATARVNGVVTPAPFSLVAEID